MCFHCHCSSCSFPTFNIRCLHGGRRRVVLAIAENWTARSSTSGCFSWPISIPGHPLSPAHALTLRKVLFPLHCHTSSHVLSSVHTLLLLVGFVRLVRSVCSVACSSEPCALSIYTCFGCGLSPAFMMRMTVHTHSHWVHPQLVKRGRMGREWCDVIECSDRGGWNIWMTLLVNDDGRLVLWFVTYGSWWSEV